MKPDYKLKSSHSVWSPALLVIAGLAGMAASYAGVRALASGTPLAQESARLPSAVTLDTSSPSVGFGQPLNLAAVVPAHCGSNGKVSFYDGATAGLNIISSQAIKGTRSTLTTASLTPGVHRIKAVYSGNAVCLPSTSAAVAQTVTKPTGVTRTTGIALASNRSSVVAGSPVNLIASVSGACGPTGKVDFYNGSQVAANLIGSATYRNGRVIVPITLKSGTYKITAVYEGDTTCDKSTSQPFSQSVTE